MPSSLEQGASQSQRELYAYVEAGALVLALRALRIERLLLEESVELSPPSAAEVDGIVEVTIEGERYPAWDLGQLLGLGPSTGGWMLLRVPHHLSVVALRTGRCLVVRERPQLTGLPSGIFREPSDAVVGAFAGRDLGVGQALVGLVVDLDRLLPAALPRAGSAERGKTRP